MDLRRGSTLGHLCRHTGPQRVHVYIQTPSPLRSLYSPLYTSEAISNPFMSSKKASSHR